MLHTAHQIRRRRRCRCILDVPRTETTQAAIPLPRQVRQYTVYNNNNNNNLFIQRLTDRRLVYNGITQV